MSLPVSPHLLALATPVFAAISQILMKWEVSLANEQLSQLGSQPLYLLHFLVRPLVLIAFFMTFLSGISWILAISRLELSQAYPYVALTYIIVPTAGVLLFGESMSVQKLLGSATVILGIGIVMLDS